MKIQNHLPKVLLLIIPLTFIFSCKNNTKDTTKDTTVKDATAIAETTPDFQISLAQWSLHKSFFGEIK